MNRTIVPITIIIISFGLNAQSNIEKLKDYISGGQLVIYSEASYLSDTMASAVTYVDFCPNGHYYYNYDGSYTVKGTENTTNRNNRANGAGVTNNSGQWQVLEQQNAYYLEIKDVYGQTNYYPINIQHLMKGKWESGNVTYVFAPTNGACQ